MGKLSSGDKRLRGSAGVKARKRRMDAHPLCALCLEQGKVTLTAEIDHIKRLDEGGPDTDDNVRGLCEPHHRQVSGYRAKVVIGVDGWPVG